MRHKHYLLAGMAAALLAVGIGVAAWQHAKDNSRAIMMQKTPSAQAQRDYLLTHSMWTDGMVVLAYQQPTELADTTEIAVEVPTVLTSEPDLLLFTGGTPHEGGYYLYLRRAGDHFVVVDKCATSYPMFPTGTTAAWAKSEPGVLIFRNSKHNTDAIAVLRAISPTDDLGYSAMEQSLTRYLLAGKYIDKQGRTWEFASDKQLLKIDGKATTYKLEEEYDMPSTTITLILDGRQQHFDVQKTAEGLTLDAQYYDQAEGFFLSMEKPPLLLSRVNKSQEEAFGLLSSHLFTTNELTNYHGGNQQLMLDMHHWLAMKQQRTEIEQVNLDLLWQQVSELGLVKVE